MSLKRILTIFMLFALLACGLAGCTREKSTGTEETQNSDVRLPEETSWAPSEPQQDLPSPVDEPVQEPRDLPDDEPLPVETVTPAPTTLADTYTYTTLNDTSFGFSFVYPSSWENVPGKYTACFRERNSSYGFPARIALTKKRMPHKPTQNQVYTEFQEYAKLIYDQYDHSTFSYGTVKRDATFLGQQAFEVSYLAYAGDVEVEGYLICSAVDYTIYVFHFCASYDAYQELGPVMARIRDSITLIK